MVAIAVVAALIAAGATFVLVGGGDDEDNTAPATTTEAPRDDRDDEEVPPGEDEDTLPDGDEDDVAAAVEDAECSFARVDDSGYIQVELEFTSPLGSPGVYVRYEIFDGDGGRFLEETSLLDGVASGEQMHLEEGTLDELPSAIAEDEVTCEVVGFDEAPDSDLVEVGDDSGCTVLGVSEADDVLVELEVTSPMEERSTFEIVYALRGGGVRFQTETAIAEDLRPGASRRMDSDSFTPVPSWTDVDEVTCEVLGIDLHSS